MPWKERRGGERHEGKIERKVGRLDGVGISGLGFIGVWSVGTETQDGN
jgi:hypothetical protein